MINYDFIDEDTLFIPKMKTWVTKKLGTTQIMERVRAYGNTKDDVILEVKLAISPNAVYIIREDLKLQEYSFKTMLDAMKQFPILFPLYGDKMLHGIFATFHVSNEMKKRVIEAGLYVAIIHDEQFKLQVPKHFKPKNFQLGANND